MKKTLQFRARFLLVDHYNELSNLELLRDLVEMREASIETHLIGCQNVKAMAALYYRDNFQ